MNTSLSPAVNLFFISSGPDGAPVYSAGPARPAEGASARQSGSGTAIFRRLPPLAGGRRLSFFRPEGSGNAKGGILVDSVTYARRFDKVTGSAIREIFKVLGRPGMISFAGGNTSLDALPDRLCAVSRATCCWPTENASCSMAQPRAIRPFWRALRLSQVALRLLMERATACFHTTGRTSGMDLLLKALVNPGDAVWWKAPPSLATCKPCTSTRPNLFPSKATRAACGWMCWRKRRAGIIPSCIT